MEFSDIASKTTNLQLDSCHMNMQLVKEQKTLQAATMEMITLNLFKTKRELQKILLRTSKNKTLKECKLCSQNLWKPADTLAFMHCRHSLF